ncbi:E3 ubiquitin-protein ligase msl-2 [Drosophila ficusphila]|uniref:E3 ubiquitin-protein ligase msl-2 n=1 Tax=Drosophila ficusphila TaxID=30025 RepID=UPI0007E6852B|nr:E3 ubiquitin-protein ligase msl-2 [Drosophila ficusphila]
MLAQSVYLKVTRLSLRSASNLSKRRVDELNAGIGELRQLLSCVVCCQLLVDPFSPKGKRCQHHVCRLCVRGKKRLFPSCTQCDECSDFRTYEENRMLGTQLLCYKTLCVHLLHSSLFGQLAGLRPLVGRELVPRIKLPPKTTQEFIREGSQISDTFDTFLPEPDLPFLKDQPTSLPAETPPTTAATTPEHSFDQHLNISEIEAEAAATAEQGHFSPLPLLPTGSRMGLMAHDGQIVIATESSESGFMEHAWTDHVDLSSAISVSGFPSHGSNFAVSYVVPTAASTPFDPQQLQIGQLVQMADSTQLAVLAAVEESMETSTQLAVLSTSFEEPKLSPPAGESVEISAQLTELPVEDQEEAMTEIEEQHEASEKSEFLTEIVQHEEDNTQSEEPPVLEETEQVEEEASNNKRKLAELEAEEHEEEKVLEEIQAAVEETVVEELRPKSVELQEEATDEPPLKRKRTRSLKASQANQAKIEPAPAEVNAKLQSGKGAFRKVRSKAKKDNAKPTKGKCRCGISGSANPLTTCRNSRCHCYTSGNSCADCNCVGCKNPHKEDFVESDEDEDEVLTEPEPGPMEKSEEPAESAKEEEKSRDCAQPPHPEPSNDGISLVPLSNLQHSQHPLVLVQNEKGEYQGFNIFQGNKPVDPTTVGFIRVQLQNNDGNSSIPQYAYVMPQPAIPDPPLPAPAPMLSPPPPPPPEREVLEPSPKKFRSSRTRRGRPNYSALDTVDELVSGGSRSNSAAGDRLSATDNAHSLFEEIMSGSDDL